MQAGHIRSIVEDPLAAAGFVVEDVGVTAAGRRSVVRVAVDRDLAALSPDDGRSVVAPLSLDEVADATRVVNEALDADPGLGNAPYVLEVSSPGVDRPLTRARHFRRNVGRLVRLTRTDDTTLEGRLVEATADQLTVLPVDGGEQRIPADAVRAARVQVEFGRIDADPAEDPAEDDLDEED